VAGLKPLQIPRKDVIDISAMECMASTLEIMLNSYSYLKTDYWPGRRGNVVSSVLGLYPCEDGYLGVHAMPRNFRALARLMDAEWMLEDERFKDAASRLQHDDELRAMVYAWASQQQKKEAYGRAGEIHAPVAYVHEIPDLFESPHLKEREYFQELQHPVAGRLAYPGPLFRMSETPAEARPAPSRSAHGRTAAACWASSQKTSTCCELRGCLEMKHPGGFESPI
jgi:crotonobetainyl-CoA:carnitine CoA-transferase CaiB-like acyl-CoA transferase